jgi:hypothetical protein
MFKKMILVFFAITLFSCKNVQNRGNSFFGVNEINKYLVYYNYDTKEICLFDMELDLIEKKYQIDFDIKQFRVDSSGFLYEFFYKENDKSIYLLGKNNTDKITKVYKINIDDFNITQIFYSENYYNKIFVNDNVLYLNNYVVPSREKLNKEQNYLISHNLLTGEETIINFNGLLPDDEQICVSSFFISENRIILTGWHKIIMLNDLFQYDLSENTVNVIDRNVTGFSIINDTILYKKSNVDISTSHKYFTNISQHGTFLFVYDFKDKNYIQLPYYKKLGFMVMQIAIIDENKIIFSDEQRVRNTPYANYYIANIFENKKKILFSSSESIDILGIMDK